MTKRKCEITLQRLLFLDVLTANFTGTKYLSLFLFFLSLSQSVFVGNVAEFHDFSGHRRV